VRIPNSMKQAIKDAFYDQAVTVHEKTVTTDAEGGRVASLSDPVGTFMGNVRYTSLGALQEAYGLTYNIDVAITTGYNGLKPGDIISYAGDTFSVTECKPSDSHFLIIGVKYGQDRD